MQLRFLYPPRRPIEAWLSEDASRPIIAEVQKLLAGYGLYEGEISGCCDAATTQAIARFQTFRGLSPTGKLDPVTYCQLLAPAATADITPVSAGERAGGTLPRARIYLAKSLRRLTLYDGNTPLRNYPVAIGKPAPPPRKATSPSPARFSTPAASSAAAGWGSTSTPTASTAPIGPG
jgi:peptidoglycan hydrolase-like protein with peptidoglycan-binding domain